MWQYLISLRELPSAAKRFIATEAFLGVGMGIVAMVLNLHFLELGLPEEEIGRITSYGSLLQGLASLPAGLLADRFGRKRMLVSGLLLMAFGIWGFGTGMDKYWLYAAQTLWSAGMSFLVTSEIQLLFQYCSDRSKESQAYGLVFAVFMLFSGAGTLLGGYLPHLAGGHSSLYEYTLYAGSLSVAVCVTLRSFLLPAAATPKRVAERETAAAMEEGMSPAGADGDTGDPGQRDIAARCSGAGRKGFATGVEAGSRKRVVKHAAKLRERCAAGWPHRKLWILSGVIFMVGFMYNLLAPYFSIIIKFRLDWNDGAVSLLLTVTSVFHFFGSVFMSYIRERWNARNVYTALFLINIAMLLLLGAALPPLLFAGLFALRGGVYTVLHNMLESETMSAVEEEDRNRFAAMRSLFRSFGNSLAAYITGWVLSANRYELPFLMAGAAMLLTYMLLIRKAAPLFEAKTTKDFG